jgi:radical SAM protein (TIGR01212 family)
MQTKAKQRDINPFEYTDSNKRYYTYDYFLRSTFGGKCAKITLDAGFTCPNIDGKCGYGGCIYCSSRGSGDFSQSSSISLSEQYNRQIALVQSKWQTEKFIPYLQAHTNTYAPIEKLKQIYFEAIKPDYIVGLAIGTRPDCLQGEVVELLSEINKIKPVSVELGLQTSNENTAKYIRRGYDNDVYLDAVSRLKNVGIEVVTHIIIGLPFENKADCLNTTKFAVLAGTDGVKFHLLHVLRNTDLAKDYENGVFKCLTLEEYAEILKECIGILPKNTVVHRITGDGAKKDLIAPLWSADKKTVINYLSKYLK